jgi:hypothetical protein
MGKKIRVARTIDVPELSRAGGHARAAALSPRNGAGLMATGSSEADLKTNKATYRKVWSRQ